MGPLASRAPGTGQAVSAVVSSGSAGYRVGTGRIVTPVA
jgi:hypothetical protein